MANVVKLIFSRKAFDSSAGGCANPILPDGTLVPLPIPDKASSIHYRDLAVGGYSLGRLVADLTHGKQRPCFGAHLDPDLAVDTYPREAGWRPLFGQAGSAQTALERAGVGVGDLFLFFGWFRRIEEHRGVLRFVPRAPDLHLLWGWLQVETVWGVATDPLPLWARYHPHAVSTQRAPNDALYVACDTLRIGIEAEPRPGAGLFRRYDARLQLTKPGATTRSLWTLPLAFAPSAGRPPLGYHGDSARWSLHEDRVELRTVGRGQEFVLDVEHYPEALSWVGNLFTGVQTPCSS